MGYSISAFIAKRGTFDYFGVMGPFITIAQLDQDYDLMLDDAFLSAALGDDLYEDVPNYETLPIYESTFSVMRELSEHTPIAYIHVDFFGGIGDQAALVWDNRRVTLRYEKWGIGPVNAALEAIGVTPTDGSDAFEMLRLYKHRHDGDWFEELYHIPSYEYYAITSGTMPLQHYAGLNLYLGTIPVFDIHIIELAKRGVTHIINLSENALTAQNFISPELLDASGITETHIQVAKGTPPTQEQLEAIASIVNSERSGNIYMHSISGIGRVGTVLHGLEILRGKSLDEAREAIDGSGVRSNFKSLSPAQRAFLKTL